MAHEDGGRESPEGMEKKSEIDGMGHFCRSFWG